MIDKFSILNTEKIRSAIFFLIINLFVFRTPLVTALFTFQSLLFVFYFTLYLLASLLPLLFTLPLKRDKTALSILIMLILLAIATNQLLSFLNKLSKNLPSRKIENTMFLNKRIKSVDSLETDKFCFTVFFPTYLPQTPYQTKFREAVVNFSDACNIQIVVLGFGNLDIIEVPKNYDYSYRKGFEDLEGLKRKALKSTKISLGEIPAYLATLENLEEGFPVFVGGVSNINSRLLYWETETTRIFMKFDSTKFSSGGYDENEILKMAESMKPIN